MTAQHPDVVTISDVSYYLSAVEGDGLFDPADHGMTTRPLSTGLYRGHICTYAVTSEQRLILSNLEIGFESPPAEPIRLAGRSPASAKGPAYDETYYSEIDLALTFTGRLLLGDGWLTGPNMGFLPGWSFERVLDVHCQDGRVTAVNDVSARMAEIRAVFDSRPRFPRRGAGQPGWIESTFSRSYAYAWPNPTDE